MLDFFNHLKTKAIQVSFYLQNQVVVQELENGYLTPGQ